MKKYLLAKAWGRVCLTFFDCRVWDTGVTATTQRYMVGRGGTVESLLEGVRREISRRLMGSR